MLTARLHHRGSDDWGSGEYGASRGSRRHTGIDYACLPGAQIVAPVSGEVTKLGYPYGDDLSYRYVQITDASGRDHRLFYVEPGVDKGDVVIGGRTVIGIAQDVAARYNEPKRRMLNHVHYEVKQGRRYMSPEAVPA